MFFLSIAIQCSFVPSLVLLQKLFRPSHNIHPGIHSQMQVRGPDPTGACAERLGKERTPW